MQNSADTATGPAMPTIDAARRFRAEVGRAAAWAIKVWQDDPDEDVPAFALKGLAHLPLWAHDTMANLERLALITGALFAAPALRVCLQAAPLLRVRALIGAPALDQVLAVPGLPPQNPGWQMKEGEERDSLYAWGAGLLINSVADEALRQSVSRLLQVDVDEAGMLPVPVAARLIELAQHIADNTSGEASP
jgi:hypothetical protein